MWAQRKREVGGGGRGVVYNTALVLLGERHVYPPNTWGHFPWTAVEFQELEL